MGYYTIDYHTILYIVVRESARTWHGSCKLRSTGTVLDGTIFDGAKRAILAGSRNHCMVRNYVESLGKALPYAISPQALHGFPGLSPKSLVFPHTYKSERLAGRMH